VKTREPREDDGIVGHLIAEILSGNVQHLQSSSIPIYRRSSHAL